MQDRTHRYLGVVLATALGATACATAQPQTPAADSGSPDAAEVPAPVPGEPRCEIVAPTGPQLSSRDRRGGPDLFAAAFMVATDIEDGQPVTLDVDGRPGAYRAQALAGRAVFPAVALAPDGAHRAQASCTARDGRVGRSVDRAYDVDSVAPALDIARPSNNAVIGLAGDVDALREGTQFQVCATSHAPGDQLCASIHGASPDESAGCIRMASATAPSCVQITCPDGSAPFQIDVSTQDGHGNLAVASITNVRCQSVLPAVRVVAPAGEGEVLNTARDQDPTTPGLQTDVVACTDRVRGEAELFVDDLPSGLRLAVLPVVAGDPCAALDLGFTGTARFRDVTLPETADAPSRGPAVRVVVTDEAGDRGGSVPVAVVVDTHAPAVAMRSCGRFERPASPGEPIVTALEAVSDTFPLTLMLHRDGDSPRSLTAVAPTGADGLVRFEGVRLDPGRWQIKGVATDAAGNQTVSEPCRVDVADPPTLTFVEPLAGASFVRAPAGTLVRLATDAPEGTPVELRVADGPAIMGTVDATGQAEFPPLALPEGEVVTLRAFTGEVEGRGVATASIAVRVDTIAPSEIEGGLTVTVPEATRRAGVVRLAWRDAGDPRAEGPAAPVARYEVRYSAEPITDENFDRATLIETPPSPGVPGTLNGMALGGLRLEQRYWFGVRAVDASDLEGRLAIHGPVEIPLLRSEVGAPTLALGQQVSGGYDVDGDGLADLVVASGVWGSEAAGVVRVYLGTPSGVSDARFVEIAGPARDFFGAQAVSLGDVNGDGLGDIAVAAPGAPVSPGASGAVYVYYGRPSWRLGVGAYSVTDADVAIRAGAASGFAGARIGAALARAGDFNGDGFADLAFGAPGAFEGAGAVGLVFGRLGLPAALSADAADVIIRNATEVPAFGRALASGGRVVGGDVREDLVVGAGTPSGAGTVFVFGGRSVHASALALTTDDASYRRDGAPTAASEGGQYLAASVGDVDGDGHADLAIGAAGGGAGEVAILFGAAGDGLREGATLAATAGTGFGSAIAAVADPTVRHPTLLDPSADRAELLVGSRSGGVNPARMYMYVGRPAGGWSDLSQDSANHTLSFSGSAADIATMGWVGDVDGDGHADVAIGRPDNAGSLTLVR